MTFIRIRPEPGTSTWVPHNQRVQQRVFSPQEYAEMGYMQREDYALDFGTADQPLSFTTSEFLVYRADSKQEALTDAFVLAVDVAIAIGTFGTASVAGRVLRSGWPIIKTFISEVAN